MRAGAARCDAFFERATTPSLLAARASCLFGRIQVFLGEIKSLFAKASLMSGQGLACKSVQFADRTWTLRQAFGGLRLREALSVEEDNDFPLPSRYLSLACLELLEHIAQPRALVGVTRSGFDRRMGTCSSCATGGRRRGRFGGVVAFFCGRRCRCRIIYVRPEQIADNCKPSLNQREQTAHFLPSRVGGARLAPCWLHGDSHGHLDSCVGSLETPVAQDRELPLSAEAISTSATTSTGERSSSKSSRPKARW